jgi:hypothetical protein
MARLLCFSGGQVCPQAAAESFASVEIYYHEPVSNLSQCGSVVSVRKNG